MRQQSGHQEPRGLLTHSKRLSHVTGMFLPPGLSSTSLSSRDSAVKFSITMSEKMARVTPASTIWLIRYTFVSVSMLIWVKYGARWKGVT